MRNVEVQKQGKRLVYWATVQKFIPFLKGFIRREEVLHALLHDLDLGVGFRVCKNLVLLSVFRIEPQMFVPGIPVIKAAIHHATSIADLTRFILADRRVVLADVTHKVAGALEQHGESPGPGLVAHGAIGIEVNSVSSFIQSGQQRCPAGRAHCTGGKGIGEHGAAGCQPVDIGCVNYRVAFVARVTHPHIIGEYHDHVGSTRHPGAGVDRRAKAENKPE